MKSRTSFCNPTVLRKDVTRFAPVWILYSLLLMMVLIAMVDMNTDYIRTLNVADFIRYMPLINLCYAALNVQLLFGDLYSARMCNALHAMPLRRECWFGTHAIAGMLYSLVPNVVFSLVCLCMLGAGWSVALWWLLAVTLQYLFFYGTALVSALLSGSRFAQLVVYVLINFLSLLAYWFADALFQPMMYGVTISYDRFQTWCPTFEMISASNRGLVYIEPIQTGPSSYTSGIGGIVLESGWGYYSLCAAIGVVLGIGALWLYKKRDLECAGDFIVFRFAKPVVLVLFTLGVGAFFQLCARAFQNSWEYFFLAVGIAVGYFIGRMLLMRTTRVFQLRSLPGLAGIAAALILSLILVKLDAFGIVRYVPAAEEVKSISLSSGYYRGSGNGPVFTEREDIEKMLAIHEYAVGNIPEYGNDSVGYTVINGVYYTYLYMEYELENGSTLERRYSIPVDSEAGQTLAGYYGTTEFVLGISEEDFGYTAERITAFLVDGDSWFSEKDPEIVNREKMTQLLEAVAADCETGAMVQDWGYHHGDADPAHVMLEMEWHYGSDDYHWTSFYVYDSCANTLAWLEENGFEISEGMYSG